MGLFNFFSQKNGHANGVDYLDSPNTATRPDIPENLFIEKEKIETPPPAEANTVKKADSGISLLFEFLEKNHEAKGYDDALINPDHTHLEQNIQSLKNEMERIIRRVKTFYGDFIREINFHIASRSRSGMIDTVEELTMKKSTAESHVQQVIEIEQDALNNKGVGQGIIISYTRGFRNGLAAISHHSILRKNF